MLIAIFKKILVQSKKTLTISMPIQCAPQLLNGFFFANCGKMK